jgi:hypothetical protein
MSQHCSGIVHCNHSNSILIKDQAHLH